MHPFTQILSEGVIKAKKRTAETGKGWWWWWWCGGVVRERQQTVTAAANGSRSTVMGKHGLWKVQQMSKSFYGRKNISMRYFANHVDAPATWLMRYVACW